MATLLAALENARPLDAIATPLGRLTRATVGRGRVGAALHGDWFGHPLHPALVQVPVGAWLSAVALDFLPGRFRRASTALLGLGTLAAVPAAASGAADFATLDAPQRRVATAHWAANVTAVALFGASFAARLRGDHRRGRTLSLLGVGAAGAGAYLGGHLAYNQGAPRPSSLQNLDAAPATVAMGGRGGRMVSP